MTLKTLITAALALLVAGLLSVPETAEAKRFGGGTNTGKQYRVPAQGPAPRQTQSGSQAASQTPGAAAAAGQRMPQQSGASRWLGPLAGLAAGGLLASMLFGDGFSGFQAMDFLLIAALGFGAFMLWRMFRRRQAASGLAGAYRGPAPAAAAAGGYQRQSDPNLSPGHPAPKAQGVRSGPPGMPGMGEPGPQPAGSDQFPHWFDGVGFIEGAKTHFVRLQAAWDKADFRDLRDYTTPQMFAEIQREREQLGGPQYTEVVRLQAELATIQRDGDLAVASIRFSGLIRESEQGVAEPFNEVWHVQHLWDSYEGDWLIAGIQQA